MKPKNFITVQLKDHWKTAIVCGGAHPNEKQFLSNGHNEYFDNNFMIESLAH